MLPALHPPMSPYLSARHPAAVCSCVNERLCSASATSHSTSKAERSWLSRCTTGTLHSTGHLHWHASLLQGADCLQHPCWQRQLGITWAAAAWAWPPCAGSSIAHGVVHCVGGSCVGACEACADLGTALLAHADVVPAQQRRASLQQAQQRMNRM